MITQVTTTMGFRYHVIGECWCGPTVESPCGHEDCPHVVIHHDIRTGREDTQPRMTAFSTGGSG